MDLWAGDQTRALTRQRTLDLESIWADQDMGGLQTYSGR